MLEASSRLSTEGLSYARFAIVGSHAWDRQIQSGHKSVGSIGPHQTCGYESLSFTLIRLGPEYEGGPTACQQTRICDSHKEEASAINSDYYTIDYT